MLSSLSKCGHLVAGCSRMFVVEVEVEAETEAAGLLVELISIESLTEGTGGDT